MPRAPLKAKQRPAVAVAPYPARVVATAVSPKAREDNNENDIAHDTEHDKENYMENDTDNISMHSSSVRHEQLTPLIPSSSAKKLQNPIKSIPENKLKPKANHEASEKAESSTSANVASTSFKEIPPKPKPKWRASEIPETKKITKGNAQRLYRLSAEEIENSRLPFLTKHCKDVPGEMHLYYMVDIERLAWGKYGGPEGFEDKLEALKEIWIKRGKDPINFPRVPNPYTTWTKRKCVRCGKTFDMFSNLCEKMCSTCKCQK